MYLSALARVGSILERGNWSNRAIDLAVSFLEGIADRLSGSIRNPGERLESAIDVEMGGSAEAVGEHTIASADLKAEIVDSDLASFALGSATFKAAAEGGPEYATAYTYCDVSGADFVFTKTTTKSGANWEEATTKVFAVDFAYLDTGTPIYVTPEASYTYDNYKKVAGGNIATADFEVQVSAEDTLADVYASAVAIEDVYSGSSIDATLAIG